MYTSMPPRDDFPHPRDAFEGYWFFHQKHRRGYLFNSRAWRETDYPAEVVQLRELASLIEIGVMTYEKAFELLIEPDKRALAEMENANSNYSLFRGD